MKPKLPPLTKCMDTATFSDLWGLAAVDWVLHCGRHVLLSGAGMQLSGWGEGLWAFKSSLPCPPFDLVGCFVRCYAYIWWLQC